jgi:hypothetical protein
MQICVLNVWREREVLMKKGSWGILLAVWWSLAATCFAAPEEKTAGPRLVMQERFFNFKEVQEGEVVEHTFTVSNTGSETLVIEEVKPG